MTFAGVSIIGESIKAAGHAINVATGSGYHLLMVTDYSRAKAIATNGMMIASLPFMVGGHRWCIYYFPNGCDSESAGSISMFLQLVDKDVAEALKVRCEFSFVDQLEPQTSSYLGATEPHNFSSGDPCWGYPDAMKIDALEKSEHLKDNCLTIRCDINIVTTAVDLLIAVPPYGIQQHMGDLLRSKEGTDVTFKVGGETFVAHRCVLAARSAVFKAELFGPMKEGTVTNVVHVEEVEPGVFQALLSFIYTDSLPEMEINMVEEEEEEEEEEERGEAHETLWLQHLLAAADRYGLQRLKVMCEEKLCGRIDVNSVATILTLAEQHTCSGLKEICLDFLKAPSNLKEITVIDGLDVIARTCPFLLKELIAKLVS